MTEEGEELPFSPRTRRDLFASVGDAGSFSVMVGMGETYIAPFAVALGTGGISTGLLTTIPIFTGSLLQLMTPHAVRRLGSHQRWVVGCAVTQGVALLLLPLAILLGGWGAGLVYLAATLYWASGQASNPAWNVWIEDVVPRSVRTRFFARRSRISQICLLTGFVTAGLLLEYGKGIDAAMLAFTGLFVTAALCRFASAGFLAAHSEPGRGRLIDEHISLAQWSRRLREHSGTRLLAFLFVMQASVYISGPYFTPYMLRELHLSYGMYMVAVSVCLAAKAVALPYWGRFAHQHGARKLLWIGALSILPLSSLWVLSANFAWIVLIQFASGLTWAAFELAIVLMFFEAIPRRERMSLVTLYNLSNSSAMVCGTFAGALVLRYFSESLTGYLVIFALSSLSRVAAVALLVRLSAAVDVPHAVEGALALHPSTNGLDKPILPGIPAEAVQATPAEPVPEVALVSPAPPVEEPASSPIETLTPRAA